MFIRTTSRGPLQRRCGQYGGYHDHQATSEVSLRPVDRPQCTPCQRQGLLRCRSLQSLSAGSVPEIQNPSHPAYAVLDLLAAVQTTALFLLGEAVPHGA
jgi:hypothetical protein